MYAIVYRRPSPGTSTAEVAFLGTEERCLAAEATIPERDGFSTYILPIATRRGHRMVGLGERVALSLSRKGDPMEIETPRR